jgi:hypothetical protein
MYRNDAQNVDVYVLSTGNELATVKDLSGNDAHLSRHVLGKTVISSTRDSETNEYVMVNTPMTTLEPQINGHPCFDGFLMQGKEATTTNEASNVPKTNASGSFTIITVVYIDTNNGPWDSLFTYGGALNSVSLYWGNVYTFEGWLGGQRMGNSGVSSPNSVMNNKNLIIMYRIFENSTMLLQILDIDSPSTLLFDGTIAFDPNSVSDVVKTNTHAPLYIACNHYLPGNGLESLSYHYHGETIIYNNYLTNTEMDDVKEFLVNKWGAT